MGWDRGIFLCNFSTRLLRRGMINELVLLVLQSFILLENEAGKQKSTLKIEYQKSRALLCGWQ